MQQIEHNLKYITEYTTKIFIYFKVYFETYKSNKCVIVKSIELLNFAQRLKGKNNINQFVSFRSLCIIIKIYSL